MAPDTGYGADEPTLRWIVERNHAETTADMARLEAQIAAIPQAMDRYVLTRVYEAERDADRLRISRLEQDGVNKVTGSRAWMAQLAVGIALIIVSQFLIARGH